MKSKEYLKLASGKDIKALYNQLQKESESLQKMKFSIKFRNLKDVRKIRATRKNIARLYTLIRQKLFNRE